MGRFLGPWWDIWVFPFRLWVQRFLASRLLLWVLVGKFCCLLENSWGYMGLSLKHILVLGLLDAQGRFLRKTLTDWLKKNKGYSRAVLMEIFIFKGKLFGIYEILFRMVCLLFGAPYQRQYINKIMPSS